MGIDTVAEQPRLILQSLTVEQFDGVVGGHDALFNGQIRRRQFPHTRFYLFQQFRVERKVAACAEE